MREQWGVPAGAKGMARWRAPGASPAEGGVPGSSPAARRDPRCLAVWGAERLMRPGLDQPRSAIFVQPFTNLRKPSVTFCTKAGSRFCQ